jgi:hypothetical protein
MAIPALVFWTTSACGFMGYLHFAELIDRGYVPLKGTTHRAWSTKWSLDQSENYLNSVSV